MLFNRLVVGFVVSLSIVGCQRSKNDNRQSEDAEPQSSLSIVEAVDEIEPNVWQPPPTKLVQPLRTISGDSLPYFGNGSAEADLRQVNDLLGHYLFLVKGANRSLPPVGSNAELVRVLLGDNPDRLALLSQDHPQLNDQGELVDRWRNPLFFHFVSHDGVEIRSAGPDGEMWNDDDIKTRRGEVHPWLVAEPTFGQ